MSIRDGGGFTWCGRKGDLTVYLTHVQFPEDHEEHGALYLRNEHRRVNDTGSPAFLIPFRDFWAFRPEDRDRGKWSGYHEMEAALANASIALYGFDVPEYRHRIHDAILEFADDVKNLKPPPGKTAKEFEAELARYNLKLHVNGERIR
jgi:hypothetical protein